MMRRPYLDFSLLFAFAGSLLLHALFYTYARNSAGTGLFVGAPLHKLPSTQPVIVAWLDPEPKPYIDPRDDFGEHKGGGEAMDSSPGEQELVGHLADQVQAFLGRLSKLEVSGHSEPNPKASTSGQGGQPSLQDPHAIPPKQTAQTAAQATPFQSPEHVPSPPHQTQLADALGTMPELAAPSSAPATLPTNAVAVQVATAKPAPAPPPVSPTKPGKPGENASPSYSAPQSDKETDPFARQNSVLFVNGRVEARDGRWVKTRKPHISDAGMLDAMTRSDVKCTFLATVDEQGNVILVRLYRSSGSVNIDLPCEEALNEWKIEPSKDASGKPIRDVVPVTFAIAG